jgi:hypothetical protein
MTPELISPEARLIAIVVLGAFVARVLYLVRYRRLPLRDSLLWLVSTLLALALMAWPGGLSRLAGALGVAVPANALFGVAFVYLALNQLAATVALSASAARVRRLAQESALLRAELDELRRGAGRPENRS